MAVPQSLIDAVQPWADFYSDHTVVSSLVMFVHLGGLLLGGGAAVAADRETILATREGPRVRAAQLADLGAVHRVVIGGLALTFVSGLLLLAADLETYGGSWLFWLKMALVAVLLANGLFMRRAERAMRADVPPGEEPTATEAWRRLHRTALTSLALWFAIVLVSTFLTAVG